MPFYDVASIGATAGGALVEKFMLWAQTVANQETCYITSAYASIVGTSTTGASQIRLYDNAGTVASGGTAQTPRPRNIRASPSAQTKWFNSTTAITKGTTLTARMTFGTSQIGSLGGWVATESGAKIALMPNGASPIDFEVSMQNNNASLTVDLAVEFTEGY